MLAAAARSHEPATSVGAVTEQDPGPGDSTSDSDGVRLTAFVRGRVQGVGFRWWVRARALELGLTGSATNLDDGRVQVVAEGGREACEQLLELLSEQPSTGERPGSVVWVGQRWTARRGAGQGFAER